MVVLLGESVCSCCDFDECDLLVIKDIFVLCNVVLWMVCEWL